VHLRATELLGAGLFAGAGLEQRRPGEEQLGLLAHQDDVVAECHLVGAAGGGVAVRHGDLRDPRGAQLGLLAVDPAAVDEQRRAPRVHRRRGLRQVAAAALVQRDERQPGAEGDVLQPQHLAHVDRVDGAALDGEVPHHHQAATARDVADAGDELPAREAAVGVVEHAVAGDRAQLEKRRARIEQQAEALARQQLSLFAGSLGEFQLGGELLVLDRAHLADVALHVLAILGELLAGHVELRFERLHQPSSSLSAGVSSTSSWRVFT
jgi:hypothetical protein